MGEKHSETPNEMFPVKWMLQEIFPLSSIELIMVEWKFSFCFALLAYVDKLKGRTESVTA